MTEKFKEIIKREVGKLPEEAQSVINTFDWLGIAGQIGKKYLLDENQINAFQVETLLLLTGITDSSLYAINIENQAGATKKDAVKIAGESFEKIFNPINKLIKENIKNNIKGKNPNWKQNVDFILSGGDYLAFMTLRENTSDLSEEKADTLLGSANMQTIKRKLIN